MSYETPFMLKPPIWEQILYVAPEEPPARAPWLVGVHNEGPESVEVFWKGEGLESTGFAESRSLLAQSGIVIVGAAVVKVKLLKPKDADAAETTKLQAVGKLSVEYGQPVAG